MNQTKRSQNLMIGIAIGIIIIIGIFLYLNYHESKVNKNEIEEKYIYNKFIFTKQPNGLWSTRLQTKNGFYRLFVHYGPKDVENISSDNFDEKLFLNKTLFITIDPTSTQQPYIAVAASEVGSSLYRVMGAKAYASCLVNDSICNNRYIIDCNSTDRPVIRVLISNHTKVIRDDNCITIMGNGTELIRSADRFIYEMYKII